MHDASAANARNGPVIDLLRQRRPAHRGARPTAMDTSL